MFYLYGDDFIRTASAWKIPPCEKAVIWATVPDRDLALYVGQTNETLQNIVIIGAKIPEDLRTTWLCISPVAMHARKEQSISTYEFVRSVPSYYSTRSGCALLPFENHTRNTHG